MIETLLIASLIAELVVIVPVEAVFPLGPNLISSQPLLLLFPFEIETLNELVVFVQVEMARFF